MANDIEMKRKIIDTAFDLAVSRGWLETHMIDIADAAGVSLAEVRRAFPSKQAILTAYSEAVDREVLAGIETDMRQQPVRDQLFDLLMRRFDVLSRHKEGLRTVLRDSRRDPLVVCAGGQSLMRAMTWMLEGAGVGTSGMRGRMRVRGLAVVYLDTLRVWLNDTSEDMARTMATLDRNLKRAERAVSLCGFAGRRSRGADREPERVSPAAPESPPQPA